MSSILQTPSLGERFEHLYRVISGKRFKNREGFGNEAPFFEMLEDTDKTKPAPLSEEDAAAVEEALSIFAPKEDPAAAKASAPADTSGSRFIASAALQDSLSSIGSYVDSLSSGPDYAKEGGAPGRDFSLFGEDGGGRRVSRDAADIETEYSRRKEEERTLRSLFTAPDDPTAPIYDLHKKDENDAAEADYETPLDTSDVSAFNDDLFRRFEDDDSVFAGLRDNDGSTETYNF